MSSWSAKEDAFLIEKAAERWSASRIAEALHKTRNSVIAMAARHNTAQQIATAMDRKVADVIALCERNGIFVRVRRRVGR